MTPEDKAEELFTTFQQYYWDDEIGWLPSEKETKKIVNKVIDEIERQAVNWGVISVKSYWISVRKAIELL